MRLNTIVVILLLALVIPAGASAALFTEALTNLYLTDRIVLDITPYDGARNITFEMVAFPGMDNPAAGWSVSGIQSATMTMTGDALSPGSGHFDLTFNDNVGAFWGWLGALLNDGDSNWAFDFSLQWTEFLAGSEVGSWTLDFENGINQTPAPVPLPASVWILLSGIAVCMGMRRYSTA